jgi:co-chaperonin GroES (HSP10)
MSGVMPWDRVLCGQYAGDEVKVDGEEFKVVAFDYILAKVG